MNYSNHPGNQWVVDTLLARHNERMFLSRERFHNRNTHIPSGLQTNAIYNLRPCV
jgi:hypothetical protein